MAERQEQNNILNSVNKINVEIRVKPTGRRLRHVREQYERRLREKLNTTFLVFDAETPIDGYFEAYPDLEAMYIERDLKGDEAELYAEHIATDYDIHFYMALQNSMESETLEISDDVESVHSFNHWLLPAKEFVPLWQNLIYEENLKSKLLRYALTALAISRREVNPSVIACNRLILLHGPPGTGKTSLCKALAQKLAIRTNRHFNHAHLIEINSHSLFSKWFSESGKLVMSLFAKIREITADSRNLVIVLIDEVESLAYARDGMSGQEPKDAMRVVNALLTQLDSIKDLSNVLILATSNLANAIDLAFLDRADIKQYVGPPNEYAIRTIMGSIVDELFTKGLIINSHESDDEESTARHISHVEETTAALVYGCLGLSGRALRKLPYLAFARLSMDPTADFNEGIEITKFLEAMRAARVEHFGEPEPT